MRILLTGISGFIGRPLAARLVADGHSVVGAVRRQSVWSGVAGVERLEIDDLANEAGWSAKLKAVDAVVHLAARVHVMRETEIDPLARFREVNVQGTRRLAEAAAAAGVGRFVYLSTVKVNGERTTGRPFAADDKPAPQDPYAISKLEAEQALRETGDWSAMEIVIVRPPLVYGPGVKGNLERLLQAVARGIPLPLGAIDNRRSMVSIGNLVDFVATCLAHPRAAGQTFLVADGEDLSTPALITAIAEAMHRPARLFPVPVRWLKGAAVLLGRGPVADRLCDSLQVDIQKNADLLQWRPVQTAGEALRQMVEDFSTGQGHG